MSSSSATAFVVANRLPPEVLRKEFTVIGDIRKRHRCRSCVWIGLLHLELIEREKSDLATEDGPRRAMFNMS